MCLLIALLQSLVMRRFYSTVFTIVLLSIGAQAQDFGIEKMIYPTKSLPHYEVNTAVPLYYWIKNFGDSIDNRVVTLEVDAEGSSPKSISFRASTPQGFRTPMDFREQAFYDARFDEISGIERVMAMMTPEGNVGDTIEVCITATVRGDINPANDQICFKIVLDANKDRDLALHILNPESGKKYASGKTVSFDLSVRNDGQEDYTLDTMYGQGQIIINNQVADFFAFQREVKGGLAMGDSASVVLDIPINETFSGKMLFCYRVVWMSDDAEVELFETNPNNNIRCVEIEISPTSIGDIHGLDISLLSEGNSVVVEGDFSSVGTIRASLYDLTGKKVNTVQTSTAMGRVSLDHSTLSPGMYVFTLEAEGTLLFKEKYWVR